MAGLIAPLPYPGEPDECYTKRQAAWKAYDLECFAASNRTDPIAKEARVAAWEKCDAQLTKIRKQYGMP